MSYNVADLLLLCIEILNLRTYCLPILLNSIREHTYVVNIRTVFRMR